MSDLGTDNSHDSRSLFTDTRIERKRNTPPPGHLGRFSPLRFSTTLSRPATLRQECSVAPDVSRTGQNTDWCRNINLLSIAFACTLRLRPDLPYVDQRCVGNLGLTVSWILTRIVATHAGILTSQRSTPTSVGASQPWQRSPTPRLASEPQLR